MSRYFKDEGLIIKKTRLAGDNLLITFFTKNYGKVTVAAYGIKTITSRRLSHLEIGNYNRFTLYKRNDRYTLSETELLWGLSKVKSSQQKLEDLFTLFFILNKILPENQPEELLFKKTVFFLTKLNNVSEDKNGALTTLLKDILVISGFSSKIQVGQPLFNPKAAIEDIIGTRIKVF